VFEPRKGLRIFAINIDALITEKGFAIAQDFATMFKVMMVVDESSRIKNPSAGRTKAVMALRRHAHCVRIATGTPVTNAPVDVFSQMEFLQSGLLGTSNYRAFFAEYAELMKPDHPLMQRMIERNPRVARAQVVARDSAGRPKWRNLDKLQRLLAPYTYRIRKDECLDLPPKIYQSHYFALASEQAKAYELMKKEQRMECGKELVAVQALSAGIKLQQITSGFVLHEGTAHYVSDHNPRLSALMDLVEDLDGQFIVWARFREEIRAISEKFRAAGIPAVTYFGDTSPADREIAIDEFQRGAARAFIGQQQAAGMGLTLTAAQTAIYYSNDFNLEHRLQSEDRCHRKGTKGRVVYIDLVAEDSIDETITRALQHKTNVAAAILGDLKS
jgi:SNF2 family DNA or RNA helicase